MLHNYNKNILPVLKHRESIYYEIAFSIDIHTLNHFGRMFKLNDLFSFPVKRNGIFLNMS